MKFLLLLMPILCYGSNHEQKKLINELRDFVKHSRPNRIPGTSGHKKIQKYLIKRLSQSGGYFEAQAFKPDIKFGVSFYIKDFQKNIVKKYKESSEEFKKWRVFTDHMVSNTKNLKDKTFKNFIWSKKAKESKEWLIIMAHYDSISHNKKTLLVEFEENGPGADYNGTGVAIGLSLIDVFKTQNLKKNLIILFTDIHSFAFLGAKYFVDNIKNYIPENDKAYVFNLEMLGHDTKAFDKNKKHNNYKAYTRSGDKDQGVISLIQKHNSSCKGKLFFDLLKNDFNNSDHIRFWETRYPSITFTQNWEDDFNSHTYQTSSDIVETINQSSFYESYKYIKCLSSEFLTN